MLTITVVFHDGTAICKDWTSFVDYQYFLDQQKNKMVASETITEKMR